LLVFSSFTFCVGWYWNNMSCVLNQDCILPCRIKNRIDSVRWSYENPPSHVIVRYDQSGSRYSESFRSRASLFEDQISRGNGDLLLRGVKVDDEGGYRCYTHINLEGKTLYFVVLRCLCEIVLFDFLILSAAPVSDIRIHQDGNRITCSSEGIYPQPELTWSTEPPSNSTLQNRTTLRGDLPST
uniref:Ig-like domain-containing protein n=1 Tax=Xiphophorus maculatus TaxID=8083 RepID=A0A3B5QH89_XIPMA